MAEIVSSLIHFFSRVFELEVIGHAFESFGGIGLLLTELRERKERAHRLLKLKHLQVALNQQEKVLQESLESINAINTNLASQTYNPDQETAKIRNLITELKKDIERLNDPLDEVFRTLPGLPQTIALILLVFGFLLQFINSMTK